MPGIFPAFRVFYGRRPAQIPGPSLPGSRDSQLQSPAVYATSNICNIFRVRGIFVRISLDKQKKLAYVAGGITWKTRSKATLPGSWEYPARW